MPLPTPAQTSAAGFNPPRTYRLRFYLIILILFAGSVLNYVDRQTVSVLKPVLKAHFEIGDQHYAFLVNAFTFTYAAAYLGCGWFIDRIGLRSGLAFSILGWSVATIGCGLSDTFATLVFFRALLGLFEPAQFPAFVRAVTLWAPKSQRAAWMGVCSSGSSIGAIISVPMIAWLSTVHSWSFAFLGPGILGVGLALLWWFVYRDPSGPAVPASATDTARAFTWSQLWCQRPLWGIALARLISDPVWYFCLFWMPGYLQEEKGLTLKQAGYVGWIPFQAANVDAFGLALLSDQQGKRTGDPARVRIRLLTATAFLGPLAMLTPHMPGIWPTIAILSIVGVACLGWLYLLGPLVSDVFPVGNVASAWAIAGSFGALGAIASNFLIGRFVPAVGTEIMFLILGTLHLTAACVLRFFFRPRPPSRIDPPEQPLRNRA